MNSVIRLSTALFPQEALTNQEVFFFEQYMDNLLESYELADIIAKDDGGAFYTMEVEIHTDGTVLYLDEVTIPRNFVTRSLPCPHGLGMWHYIDRTRLYHLILTQMLITHQAGKEHNFRQQKIKEPMGKLGITREGKRVSYPVTQNIHLDQDEANIPTLDLMSSPRPTTSYIPSEMELNKFVPHITISNGTINLTFKEGEFNHEI